MNKLKSYRDLKKYIEANPLNICWYGPRSADVMGLEDLLNITGIVSCYYSGDDIRAPHLTNDGNDFRGKCSVDNLAKDLISRGKFDSFISKNRIKHILPYDSNFELELLCKKNLVSYLSSSDRLKEKFRDKTKIDEISRNINMPTIPGIPGTIDDFEFQPLADMFGLPLFLHFAEGAGGSGNRIVSTVEEFAHVKAEQKGKRLNAKKYFEGSSYTIDICVTPTATLCGALEEMIIGCAPLNSNPTEYVASSWFANNHSLEMRVKIKNIGVALGELLRSAGFIGMFHPDFLIDSADKIVLTELNMRFGGSCGAYAKIQMNAGQIPLIVAHILSFIDPALEFDADEINKESLEPQNHALMVLKNNKGKTVKIPSELKPGFYKLSANKFLYTGETGFKRLQDGEIYITGMPCSKADVTVEDGAYLFEVMTGFPISNSESKLNGEGQLLAENLFEQFTY